MVIGVDWTKLPQIWAGHLPMTVAVDVLWRFETRVTQRQLRLKTNTTFHLQNK